MSNETMSAFTNMNKQIIEQLPTSIMTVDKNFKIVFLNKAGCEFLNQNPDEIVGKNCHDVFNTKQCRSKNCGMMAAMNEGKPAIYENEVEVDGQKKYVECTTAPLINEKGEIIGGLESVIDITQRVLDDKKLMEQSQAIREMSTPTIKLWDGILVLPVIGVIDSARAQYMMDSILNRIMDTSSKVIILDIQGVAAVDTAVANHIIKITKATKLMGCECLLSGIYPAVAQTIIQLGINMASIRTNSTLSDALNEAFSILDLEVINRSER